MFFNEVKNQFGQNAATLLKSISNFKRRYNSQKNKATFLVKCRQHQVLPKFLHFKMGHIKFANISNTHKWEKNYKKFLIQTLSLLITDCIQNQKQTLKDIQTFIELAKTIFPAGTVEKYIATIERRSQLMFEKEKKRQITKLQTLINNELKGSHSETLNKNKQWLNNLTTINIPDNVKNILALGPKFAFHYNNKQIPINDIIANIEIMIENKSEEAKFDIRTKICNSIKNHMNNPHRLTFNQIQLNNSIKETKVFLKSHPELYVINADKAKQTVIMYKEDYEQKMNNLLADTSTYKPLNKDPTTKQQTINNNLISRWVNELIIDLKTAYLLKIHNAQPPRIYGLAKTHKQGIPLRPIVNFIQAPTYNLSKYLANILTKITGKSEQHVKDSWSFVEHIKKQTIPPNHILVSLDVISLYTNTPIKVALEVIEKKWDTISENTHLPKAEFIEAVKLCLDSSYFVYQDKFYEQTFGLPMGAPLSSVVANLVLEDLEQMKLNECQFTIPMYKRYVDDIIAVIPENKENTLLTIFNTYHQRLQFTIEKEENKEICFLDFRLIRKDNHLQYTWYTKPSWTGRYLNYNAELPAKYKKSVVSGLVTRAICFTNPENRPEQIKKVIQTLKNNDYPDSLIHSNIKQQTHNSYHIKSKNKQLDTTIRCPLPYVKGLTEKIQHILKPHNLTVASQNTNNINYLFTKLKNKKDKRKQTHVIYSIPCIDCNGIYIGQTKQYIENRIKAHKNSTLGKNRENTALKKHGEENNHKFDYENYSILDYEINEKKRLIKEMIYIKKETNSVNDRKDIQNLSNFYNDLIH